MSRKQWLIILIAGVSICALSVLGFVIGLAGGVFFFNTPSEPGLPTYTFEQIDSVHEGYRRTTLTNGNIVYVSDYEEIALFSINIEPPDMIGRFPVSEEGVSGVYIIPGQDPSAYVLEYDPMYQAVYRNINHPPFDWRTAEFQQMLLMPAPSLPENPKESNNILIINDVLNAMKNSEVFTVEFRSDGAYVGHINRTLLLSSDQLPGLMYGVGVHVNANREVYLAENFNSNEWYPAGELFIEWMNAPQ